MKAYYVTWFDRVFGTFDTKEEAREAVDNVMIERPKLTLADFTLIKRPGKKLNTRSEVMNSTDNVLDIIQIPNPLLHEVSLPVTEFNQDLVDLAKEMVTSMFYHNGRGLSAVQVGIKSRLVVAYADEELLVMTNPVFLRNLKRETIEFEGCLSLKPLPQLGKRKVSRPAKIELRWQDLNGNIQEGNFTGDQARVLQHEIDHLDGILIIDKPLLR